MDNIKYGLTFWGLFRNKATEMEYINKIGTDVASHGRLGVMVAGIGYWIVSVADFAKLGLSNSLYISFLARSIFLVLCVISFLLIKRIGTYKAAINLSFLVTISSSILIIFVIYILNPDGTIDPIDQVTVPVVTLILYTFMQIPLIMLFINGIAVTVLYTFLLLLFMKDSADSTINIIIMLVVINFIGVCLNRFINKSHRRDYANRATIENLNENLKQEIEERKTIQHNLENAFEQITDSMKYAQKIQFALMSSNNLIQQNFKESSLFFRPQNIVSGDFYWVCKKEDKIILAVADCTGHGIPGAFMSVLGISLLNDIIRNYFQNQNTISAKFILDNLRDLVIVSLNKDGEDSDRRDGMDMSLLVIDKENKTILFAGAYNPLWILRSEEGIPSIIEYNGDRMPIGIHTKKAEPFTEHLIQFRNDDIIYLFTDGYKDQFGGKDGKKLPSKRFKEILLSVHDQPLLSQHKTLVENFESWKGNYVQVDDVLVMALKL